MGPKSVCSRVGGGLILMGKVSDDGSIHITILTGFRSEKQRAMPILDQVPGDVFVILD